MNKVKNKMGGILYCIIQAAVGVLLLVNPVGFTSGIIRAIGIILTAAGIAGIIKYFKTPVSKAALEQTLTRGLLAAMAGLFCIMRTDRIIGFFPMITVFYGVIMLIVGVSKIQLAADAVRRKEKRLFLAVISAVITLICAGIVISNPFESTETLWRFTGAAIIIDAVFDIVASFFMKNTRKEYEDIGEIN